MYTYTHMTVLMPTSCCSACRPQPSASALCTGGSCTRSLQPYGLPSGFALAACSCRLCCIYLDIVYVDTRIRRPSQRDLWL